MIRFHLDQNVDFAVARGLRTRGINVVTTAEAGLQGAPDEDHLAFALAESRVIFTQDRDFTRMQAAGMEHAGVVYSKNGTRSVGQIVQFLELMNECVEAGEMRGQLEYF